MPLALESRSREEREGRPRRRWKGPVVACAALLAGLAGAELYFACFAPVDFHRPLDPRDPAFDRLHRASAVPGLEYELVPGAALYVDPWRTVVHVNRLGLRGSELEQAKAPGVFRIAAVGDSFTFGNGVADEDTYPRQLEALLPPRADGRRYEVLNFGVSGYSSADEAAVLRERVAAFSPDLVLVGYVLNDPQVHPDNPVHRVHHPPELWERFHVTRRLAKAREDRAIAAAGDWFRYLHATPRHWNTVISAFESMRDTAASWRVPLVLVLMPMLDDRSWASYSGVELHRQVAELGERTGFRVLDMREPLAEIVPNPRALRLPGDHHANARGNRAFAEVLRGYLAREFPADF
jgi:lysophospholipase L1-like esterase